MLIWDVSIHIKNWFHIEACRKLLAASGQFFQCHLYAWNFYLCNFNLIRKLRLERQLINNFCQFLKKNHTESSCFAFVSFCQWWILSTPKLVDIGQQDVRKLKSWHFQFFSNCENDHSTFKSRTLSRPPKWPMRVKKQFWALKKADNCWKTINAVRGSYLWRTNN